jgi:hypothetical protein
MRKPLINGVYCVLLLLTFAACRSKHADTVARPRLVVGIVVDQMRWDYLYRYYDRYGEGGFKRLMHHGFSCDNTMINYLPAFTAVGPLAASVGMTGWSRLRISVCIAPMTAR